MKKLVSTAIVICMFLSAFTHAAPGWTGKVKVKSIFSVNENQAIISLSSFNNPASCLVNRGPSDSGHAIIDPSLNKQMFSLLLTAFVAGKDVDIYVRDKCVPIWQNSSFAEIGHVRIH